MNNEWNSDYVCSVEGRSGGLENSNKKLLGEKKKLVFKIFLKLLKIVTLRLFLNPKSFWFVNMRN